MARKISRAWLLAPIMCCFVIPLPAHHSFGAEYDTSKPVQLTGIVTKIEWTNPHSFLYVDVQDDKGSVVNWKLEGYPALLEPLFNVLGNSMMPSERYEQDVAR